MEGQRSGVLLVVSRASHGPTPQKHHLVWWNCLCQKCGKTVCRSGTSLRTYPAKGCSPTCSRRKYLPDRNAGDVPEWRTWSGMLRRCTYAQSVGFMRYGGRGIRVCTRWRKSFTNFLADMGVRPKGKSLDRIDNDGPYSPENCRWATRAEQMQNTSTNHYLTFGGKTLCAAEWARRVGVSRTSLLWRIENWPVKRAFTEPSRCDSGKNCRRSGA